MCLYSGSPWFNYWFSLALSASVWGNATSSYHFLSQWINFIYSFWGRLFTIERLYEIQVTDIYSRAILVAVTSDCHVKSINWKKPGLEHRHTVWIQIRRRTLRRLIRVYTVRVNYRKLRVKLNSLLVPIQDHFLSLHSETTDPAVLSVLWFSMMFHGLSIEASMRAEQSFCIVYNFWT